MPSRASAPGLTISSWPGRQRPCTNCPLPPAQGHPPSAQHRPRQCTGGKRVRVFQHLGPCPCPIFPAWCRWIPFHGGSAELNSVSPKFMSTRNRCL